MSSGIPYWPCDKCNKNILDERVHYICKKCGIQLCQEHGESIGNLTCEKCGRPLEKHVFKLNGSYYP